ncbi:MAG: DNA recombination protein RmuC [Acidobacteria bacterium]|nr:DNA recombination protein RmuC [Acidobacteriota bacterium]
MLLAVAALSAINFVCLVLLLMRRSVGSAVDPRLAQLPDAMVQMQARIEALDGTLRNSIGDLRREQAHASEQAREAASRSAQQLREEVLGNITNLGNTLRTGFDGFRSDNSKAGETLRTTVDNQLAALGQRLSSFISEVNAQQVKAQETLHSRLNELGEKQNVRLDQLGVQQRDALDRLNQQNAAKLEEMRVTVDEKLHATLETRLTQSFGTVSDQLQKVSTGLGEMKDIATSVGDLKKVFSNVKSRGIVGEFQLGMQLEQMFSPEQYVKNARIKQGSLETVEYALKFPNGEPDGVLLPIDAKFPREDWERLESAYESGSAEDIAKAGAAFERTIRAEGKRICEKYIEEPTTLPHAIMFLPTEALYAEVVRRPGLQSEVQQKCRVTIAGPSTFMAILTSFQMGFHTIALEKKGNEVWKVLANVKTEFGKFETLMTKVEDNVGKVQKSLSDIGVRTRAINRNLRNVTELPSGESTSPLAALEEFANVAPLLAASEE